MRASVDAALAAHWSGAIMWALGYENTALYQQLGRIAPQRGTGALAVALDPPVITDTTAAVTGVAVDPEFDLPLPVTLTLTNTTTSKVVATRTVSARATRVGLPAGSGPFHGIDATFASLVAGNYRVCASARLWANTATAPAPCRTFTVTAPAV
jgi:hypothetical protein